MDFSLYNEQIKLSWKLSLSKYGKQSHFKFSKVYIEKNVRGHKIIPQNKNSIVSL